MKIVPAQLGADRKKVMILGGLVVVLVIVFLWNRGDSTPEVHAPSSALTVTPVPAPYPNISRANPTSPAAVPQRNGRSALRSAEEFKPSLKPQEGVDVSKIDPTLKLDLLARLKNVPLEPGPRGSVFDWGKAPPPPPQEISKMMPGPMAPGSKGGPGSPGAKIEAPKPTGPPPPPPIPLKFYGYSAKSGSKRAFFLDADDIVVAGENDVIKNRYKIVRIGVNSVVVEDLTNKNQQTLPLVEELAG